MIDKLDGALRFHQEALNLRAERQQVLAGNIANADTPNYKARDFDFAAELDQVMTQGRASANALSLNTTSSRHLPAQGSDMGLGRDLLYRVPDQPSLDGNTVDMDRERTNFTDNAVRYQANLTILSRKIQGLKSAMQPE
ncbi:flagellar basal body rod protein FlgB [Halomonas shantousis]